MNWNGLNIIFHTWLYCFVVCSQQKISACALKTNPIISCGMRRYFVVIYFQLGAGYVCRRCTLKSLNLKKSAKWDIIVRVPQLFVYIIGSLGPSSGSNASFDITADLLQIRLKGQVTAGATQLGWTLTLQTWLTPTIIIYYIIILLYKIWRSCMDISPNKTSSKYTLIFSISQIKEKCCCMH